jgi:hypothetical protein
MPQLVHTSGNIPAVDPLGASYTFEIYSLENPDGSLAGVYQIKIYLDDILKDDSVLGYEAPYPNGMTLMDAEHWAIDWITRANDYEVVKPEPTDPIIVGNGIGTKTKLLNVAGFWTIGVAQGTLFMLVPMVMIGISVGFMRRVVKAGARVGGV